MSVRPQLLRQNPDMHSVTEEVRPGMLLSSGTWEAEAGECYTFEGSLS